MQAAALTFPLLHPAVVTVVSGGRNGEQMKANIGWFEEEIPASFWKTLKDKGVISVDAPIGA